MGKTAQITAIEIEDSNEEPYLDNSSSKVEAHPDNSSNQISHISDRKSWLLGGSAKKEDHQGKSKGNWKGNRGLRPGDSC